MSEQEFQFEIAVTPKPVAGVSVLPVPENLAKHLGELVPKVLKSDDHELTITAANDADAAKLAAHAKRWGAQQTPELYIHKVPNGKRYPANVARLAVKLASDVTPDNRPGRRTRS
jgi:hypothetical protein